MDKILQKLKDIQQNAAALNNQGPVSSNDMFTEEFMVNHTGSHSLKAFFHSGGFENFPNVDANELDAYIQQSTDFKSWKDMQKSAAREYYKKKLFS